MTRNAQGWNQLWQLDDTHVVAKDSGLVLDIDAHTTGSGARVIMWSRHNNDNQQFDMIDNMIISRRDQTVLDVYKNVAVEGTEVVMWDQKPGQLNQKWNQIRQCRSFI